MIKIINILDFYHTFCKKSKQKANKKKILQNFENVIHYY